MAQPAPPGTAILDRLCSIVAAAGAEDPIGSGGNTQRLMAIEIPTPWGEGLYNADADGTVLQRVQALRIAYFARLREEHGGLPADGFAVLNGIAPDPEWSVPGKRRVLIALRPEDDAPEYAMSEYLVPDDEEDALVALVRAYFDAPERLDEFARYRSAGPPHREFFVCTHGHVDICCARFGVPLYLRARAAYPLVRAWRMTHFGGHRFAPTAWEFPSGHKWAFLDDEASDRVLHRDGDAAGVRRNLRGWSAVPPVLQVIEGACLARHGWDWLRARRTATILEADEVARIWRVRVDFAFPGGASGAYLGTIEVARDIALTGCGPAFEDGHGTLPEYRLDRLELV